MAEIRTPLRTGLPIGEQAFWEDAAGNRTQISLRAYDDWGAGRRRINGAVWGARCLLFDTPSGYPEADTVVEVAGRCHFVVSDGRQRRPLDLREVPTTYRTTRVQVRPDIVLDGGEVIRTVP